MKKRIMKMTSIILVLSMLVALALPVSAGNLNNPIIDEDIIDQDMATTIALLFVASNLELENEWDMNLSVKKIVPLYGANDGINAYCIEMVNNNQCAGYVTVSTDMNCPLIQEYAPGVEPLFEDSNADGDLSTMSVNGGAGKVYYAGPLQYSNNKNDASLMAENTDNAAPEKDDTRYSQNAKLINYISETGTIGDLIENTASVNGGTIIENPLAYLQSKYPSAVFSNTGWKNLGESAITRYYIYEKNACAMYAISAIIKYYINAGTAFTTIKNKVLQLYEDTYNNGEDTSNYYLKIGQYKSFTQKCLNYYGISKTASSCLSMTWTLGKTEIDNGRPYMLNIATGNDGLYNDHTVTVYAYTGFTSNETSTYHYFYKVRDGFTNEASSTDNGRYVANDALGAAYITRVS